MPEDGFDVVLTCDGTDLEVAAECNYRKTIGTAYTAETSEHMSISSGVHAEIEGGMFFLMGSMGVSSETGYNWNRVSSDTMSEEESFEVLAVVPAGMVLYIEQAVGHCNGNTAKTELFKLSQVDGRDGKLVRTWYERAFKNGTTVEVEL